MAAGGRRGSRATRGPHARDRRRRRRAAWVLAGVAGGRMMREVGGVWPQYEFARHKGYITPEHTAALTEHGPCPQHRHSYVNVKAAQLRLDGVMSDAAMTARLEVSA